MSDTVFNIKDYISLFIIEELNQEQKKKFDDNFDNFAGYCCSQEDGYAEVYKFFYLAAFFKNFYVIEKILKAKVLTKCDMASCLKEILIDEDLPQITLEHFVN